MARAIERIERDIAALEEAVRAIAAELHSAYATYLTALGQAVRQQTVLASYHLCTQGYPESFVSLSFSNRQELQQEIRKLAQHAESQLVSYTKIEEESGREGDGGDEGDATAPSPASFSNPEALVRWHYNLEMALAKSLKTVSRDVNHLLQQAGILPSKLPQPLLEAAATSEAAREAMAGPPNLLNLLIETKNDEDSEDSTVTHIIAIQLRLSEIEFADATVRAGRSQIKNLLLRVNSHLQEYQKKQREWAVASAEAAWRASWFDE